jgi:hypothetical protein
MKFVYPEFLWALFALAIPIIIHLFNFRKYKTLYFSSLKFIKHVDQQTRSTQKLKHLLVLILRLFALACLIIAFAQPFIPVETTSGEGGKPVLAIYIDNSFSMTAKGTEGELVSEAREMARKMINNATLETRILLNTNQMSGLEQRLVTKIEALERLDKIEPIPLVRKLDDVLNWQRTFIDKESETNQKVGTRQYVFFSDFQKSSTNFTELKEDKTAYYYPVLLTPQEKSNIYIDSVWFSSPIQKVGQNNELNIRIVNSSKEDLTNIELHCEIDGIKRDVFMDISANQKSTTIVNYTEKSGGYKSGKLSVNDMQLFWDDEYYLSYFVDNQTTILVVKGEQAVDAVSQVYNLEEFYKVKTIDQNAFTLDDLKQIDLVFLNGINEIPSGMVENLTSFAQSGGSIALFPGAKAETGSWNSLLRNLQLPTIGRINSVGTKIDKLIYDDPFFYGMFEKKKENLNLPSVTKAYQTFKQDKSSFYELIRLQNGTPLFLRSEGSLNTFLFTSSLDNSFGTFTSDALFPSIILRIGEMSQRKSPISLIIGKESYYPLYKKESGEIPIHLKNDKVDFIPQIQKRGLINYISLSGQEALEILSAGTYDIVNGKKEGILSLNYDRNESSTETFTADEIVSSLENQALKHVTFSEISEGQSLTKIDIEKPFEYWKLFTILTLIFLLSEMMVIKFWK